MNWICPNCNTDEYVEFDVYQDDEGQNWDMTYCKNCKTVVDREDWI